MRGAAPATAGRLLPLPVDAAVGQFACMDDGIIALDASKCLRMCDWAKVKRRAVQGEQVPFTHRCCPPACHRPRP
jgi:hypothetical protein